ncbi:RraA family protein [Bacillus velezensis]|uniref:RraA family protein n=1 Tax=Bacillus velezensis TaxID=492670 RepID=UPI0023E28590|nr:RraA family protein [Bacillus velezensis]WES02040.1 RraA family protein [Bacillus velezensis]
MSVLGYRVGSLGTGWYCCCETARVDYYSYAVRKCVLGAFFQANNMLGICGDCTRASRLLSKYGCPGGDDSTPVIDAVTTNDRILVIAGGVEGVSSWGDIIANAAKMKNIRGSIIDGNSRDINGSRDIGYPVFGRGVTMISARNRLIQVDSGGPVEICRISYLK